MLKAKLYEIELQKKEQQANKEHEQKTDIGWGASNSFLCITPISNDQRFKN